MTIRPGDIGEISDLVRLSQEIKRMIAKHQDHDLNLYESEMDRIHHGARIPISMAMDVMGAIHGMVETRLIARGVKIDDIEERECFECGGTGKADK